MGISSNPRVWPCGRGHLEKQGELGIWEWAADVCKPHEQETLAEARSSQV